MFRKKVLGLTMIALMIGCMGASVSAHEADDVATVSEIMPRGASCDRCGVGELIKKVENQVLDEDDYPCSHYDHGRDLIKYIKETTYYICNSCDYETEKTYRTYYVTNCQGYN